MYKSGHRGINMILYSPILFVMVVFEFILAGLISLGLVIYFSSLPDIDLRTRHLTHRGFTHTYSFGIVVGIIFSGLYTMLGVLGISIGLIEPTLFNLIGIPVWGFFIGLFTILGHISGDIITYSGVRPFNKPKNFPDLPIFTNKKYTANLLAASNSWANIGFLIMGIGAISLSFFLSITIRFL